MVNSGKYEATTTNYQQIRFNSVQTSIASTLRFMISEVGRKRQTIHICKDEDVTY